jgi:hypothetical protein
VRRRHAIGLSAFLLLAATAQAVDESKLVRFPGNTHIAARPEFDEGAVPDDFLGHIQLLLKRLGLRDRHR